jgi:hypothetical protein
MNELKPIYILNNAPSLSYDIKDKIDFLRKQELIVTNQFINSKIIFTLNPRYYVLLDPVYWEENRSESEIKLVNDLFENLLHLITWDMLLFVPNTALNSKRVCSLTLNSHIKLIPFSAISLYGFRKIVHYWYKKNLGMPSPQSVLVASIHLALNSGFKEINILGADHSWIKQLSVGYDNLIYYEDNHFYDAEKTQKKPFDGENIDWTIEKWLLTIAKMYRSYYILNDYAQHLNAKIYNMTTDTLLDVYERKEFNPDN